MAKKVTAHVWVEHDEKGSVLLKPGDPVPSWAKDQVTNPACFATTDQPDEEPDTGSAPDGAEDYMSWTRKALEDEVARRNAEYPEDDQVDVEAPGNKPELAAALVDDDERLAADPDGDDSQE